MYQTRVTDSEDIEVDIDESGDNPDSPGGAPSMDEKDAGVHYCGAAAAAHRLCGLPDSSKGENVVGAEGVPLAIIEAERKSKPLRRYRLGSYALALVGGRGADGKRHPGRSGGRGPPGTSRRWRTSGWTSQIISGTCSGTELQNRAGEPQNNMGEGAPIQEESLKRAEAGLGDTVDPTHAKENPRIDCSVRSRIMLHQRCSSLFFSCPIAALG